MIWKSEVTIVDTETGEILTRKHINQGLYVVIRKTVVNNKISKNYGIKRITWQAERNRQKSLF